MTCSIQCHVAESGVLLLNTTNLFHEIFVPFDSEIRIIDHCWLKSFFQKIDNAATYMILSLELGATMYDYHIVPYL